MSGLEILGGVGVSLQLIKAAGACLSIVHDVRQIGQISRDQNDAHLNLRVQAHKFESWCSALKIPEMIEATDSGQDGPLPLQTAQLKEAIESQLRLSDPNLVDITLKALNDMRAKFAEATNLISKYSIVSEKQPSSTLEVPKGKLSTKWNRFMRKGSQSSPLNSDSLSISSDRPGPISERGSTVTSRTKWVTSDKKTLNELLESIETTNGLLVVLLDPVLQTQVDRKTDLSVLGNINYTTLITTKGLPGNSELRELAKIKQWQRRERKEETQGDDTDSTYSFKVNPSDSPPVRVHSYQIQDFNRGALPHGEHRSLTILENKEVFVEWKYYSNQRSIRHEQTLRLGGLVGLLRKNGPFRKFCTLPCEGLVEDTLNSRIGIVFSAEGSVNLSSTSLQSTISRMHIPAPIGQRFTLAKNLVTAVHHLHSVDWLHKSIRSNNVICFSAPEPKISQNVPSANGTTIHENGQVDRDTSNPIVPAIPISLPRFFLVGWDLSRPDHPSELSETLSVSTAGYQSNREAVLMYSHPDVHSVNSPNKRPRYRAQYDIYSLGLVLLEIGLWRTLSEIRGPQKLDDDFRLKLRTEYCDRLLYRMGEIYWKVVQRCLNNDFGLESSTEIEEEDFPLQVAFEKHVVCELERCRA